MPLEIERRFLLDEEPEALIFSKELTEGVDITQGYFSSGDYGLRLRSSYDFKSGTTEFFMTHKTGTGLVREETEIAIPVEVYDMLYPLTEGAELTKRRRHLGRWEIDEFDGPLKGLWIAEIEIDHPDEEVNMPEEGLMG